MTERCDRRYGVQPMFAAKSDQWDAEWRTLSGFSDIDIQARRQLLRRVPRTSVPGVGQSRAASGPVEVGRMGQVVEYELGYSYARFLAREYLDSNPGLDDMAGNQFLHGQSRRLITGDQLDSEVIEKLVRHLDYRLFDVITTATTYRNLLQVKFPACRELDSYAWKGNLPKTSIGAIKNEVWETAFNKLLKARLFDKPVSAGNVYLKGVKYLAALMANFMWSDESMDDAIKVLKAYHGMYLLMLQEYAACQHCLLILKRHRQEQQDRANHHPI